MRRLALAMALCACLPTGSRAQSVLVQVRDAGTAGPLMGALAELLDPDGAVVARTLSDDVGRALIRGVVAGPYRVRVEMIGRATAVTELFRVAHGEAERIEVTLSPRPIELAGVSVDGDRRCRPLGGGGAPLERLWDEARKALSAASLTAERGGYRYLTERFERRVSRDGTEAQGESWTRREGFMRQPFESRPAEELIEGGYVQEIDGETVFLAPSADVLLSDAFLTDHCFHVERESGRVGLGFRPSERVRGLVRISGVMWLEDGTSMLSALDYRYEGLDPDQATDSVGGRVEFARLPDGKWMIPEWWIRMPVVTQRPGFDERTMTYVSGYKVAGGRVLDVKAGGGRSLGRNIATGSIEGVVVDSLGAAVVGARVGLVGSSQDVFTDRAGRFGITRLREGTYEVRAAPNVRSSRLVRDAADSVSVVAGEASEVTLFIEHAASRLPEACDRPRPVEGLVGVHALVVNASGEPVEDALVRVTWNEYNFSGVVAGRQARDLRRVPQDSEARTNGDGEVLFCQLPARSRLTITATRGEATSVPVELVIDEEDFGRAVELRVSALPPPPTARALVVQVVDARDEALPGAEVHLPDLKRHTISDAVGRAVFTSVPLGHVDVRVESVGRVPREETVIVADTGVTVVTALLSEGAFELAPVTVEVETPEARAARVSGSSASLALSDVDIQELVARQGVASLGQLIDAGGLGRFQWEDLWVQRQHIGSCLRHSRTNRGLQLIRGETHTCAQVVLNGAWLSVVEGANALRTFPLGDIESIQFLPAGEAALRFGTSFEDKPTHNGVFVIETHR